MEYSLLATCKQATSASSCLHCIVLARVIAEMASLPVTSHFGVYFKKCVESARAKVDSFNRSLPSLCSLEWGGPVPPVLLMSLSLLLEIGNFPCKGNLMQTWKQQSEYILSVNYTYENKQYLLCLIICAFHVSVYAFQMI